MRDSIITKNREIRNHELAASLRDARTVLELVESRIREVAPAWCCEHDAGPCLTCGLEWLIQEARTSRPGTGPVIERPAALPSRGRLRLIEFPARA
jgi:hypothetical protein